MAAMTSPTPEALRVALADMEPGRFETVLRHVPEHQRCFFRTVRAFDVDPRAVVRLTAADVEPDGLRIGRDTIAWASDATALRAELISRADGAAPSERLFDPQKPAPQATYDFPFAWSGAERRCQGAAAASPPLEAPLPTVLGLGAPRCGTTWLYEQLARHPDVCLPKLKELEFFGTYRHEQGLCWLHRQYRHHAGEPIVADISVGTLYAPQAIDQIQQDLAGARPRFVVMLRDPVARAYSYYNYRLVHGTPPPTFEEALALKHYRELFLEQGHYARYLRPWIDAFGRDAVLVLLYDDLVRDPAIPYGRLCEFLGIDPARAKPLDSRVNLAPALRWRALHRGLRWSATCMRATALPGRRHIERGLKALDRTLLVTARPGSEQMSADLRRRLGMEFAESNRELARLTGLDLSAWEGGSGAPTEAHTA